MALLRIRSNTSEPAEVGVDRLGDFGAPIPGLGGFIDLDDIADVVAAQDSQSLRELLEDNAYPPEATLILVETGGFTDIPQADALDYLDNFQGDRQIEADISEASHEPLDTLAHEIVEGSWDEVTYVLARITNITTWDSPSKNTKIREQQFSYTSGRVTEVVNIQYDASGTETYRITETITYAFVFGNRVANITRVRTP